MRNQTKAHIVDTYFGSTRGCRAFVSPFYPMKLNEIIIFHGYIFKKPLFLIAKPQFFTVKPLFLIGKPPC